MTFKTQVTMTVCSAVLVSALPLGAAVRAAARGASGAAAGLVFMTGFENEFSSLAS